MTERSCLVMTVTLLVASALCVREIATATDDTRALAFLVLSAAIALGQLLVACFHLRAYRRERDL